MVNQAAINTVLTICGFCTATERNLVLGGKGLNSWAVFTLIDYDGLPSITKNASCHIVPFSIGVINL